MKNQITSFFNVIYSSLITSDLNDQIKTNINFGLKILIFAFEIISIFDPGVYFPNF